MILPLNKYNVEDLSNTKFYKNITELGKTTLSTLDFQKYYPRTQIFAWKTTLNLQKFHTLLDLFYMNLVPYSRYAHTVLDCEKRTFLREFLDEPDTPSWHSSATPRPGVAAKMTSPI